MATTESSLYDELIDLLAENTDIERLMAFRLSRAKQVRLDDLLARNHEHALTREEEAELDAFERLEHLVRLVKARLLGRRAT